VEWSRTPSSEGVLGAGEGVDRGHDGALSALKRGAAGTSFAEAVLHERLSMAGSFEAELRMCSFYTARA
jgi:hypothetical protein